MEFSHIWEGKDFFDIDNIDVDCIVSNPPFSKRQSVFEKLYELGKPFAMIINMNGLFDAKSRWQLFSEHKFELLIPKGRIKFSEEQELMNDMMSLIASFSGKLYGMRSKQNRKKV